MFQVVPSPMSVCIENMSLESMEWLEKTARLVAQDGSEFENTMMYLNTGNKLFSFLRSSDPSHALYQQKVTEYRAQTLVTHAPTDSHLETPPYLPLKDAGFVFPADISLSVMKLAAQFGARYGIGFSKALMARLVRSPQFDFMKPMNISFSFYNALLVSYAEVIIPKKNGPSLNIVLDGFFHRLQVEKLEEGLATAILDLHAFVSGVDSFAYLDDGIYSAILPPPQPLSIMMPQLGSQLSGAQDIQPDASATRDCVGDPPIRITLKELGIIKLTSLFVARYGIHFRRALMLRVVMNPLFEFMFFRPSLRKKRVRFEPTETRFNIFNVLVDAYSKVLMPSKTLRKSDACTRPVIEDFLKRLQPERLEEGVEKAVIDLHALMAGVDCFAHMDYADYSANMPPPERLSVMMTRQPDMLLQLPLGSQLAKYSDCNQHDCVGDSSLRLLPLRSITFRVPASGITLKELGIMKLTAQFVVRYGFAFWGDLYKIVCSYPSFAFLNPSDSRFNFYCGFTAAYSSVLKLSKMLKKPDACTANALEGFFHRLQLWKLLKGVEMASIDLHAFVGGVDCFAHLEDVDYSAIMAAPDSPSIMITQLTVTQMQPPLGSRLTEYRAQYQGGTRDIQPDAPATSRDRLFLKKHRYYFPYAFCGWISLKELGIMKFTALFVARYGMHFCRDFMKSVVEKPEFKFMEPTSSKFSLYNVVVDAYSRVVKPCDGACTATVVEDFLGRLQLEELGDEAMIDLHAFVSGVEYFADVEDVDYSALMPPPELLSSIMNRIPSMRKRLPLEYRRVLSPSVYCYGQFADLSMGAEEPEAKRQKIDESALVPEDQFLAQNPGPARIKDVADDDDGATEIKWMRYRKMWQV